MWRQWVPLLLSEQSSTICLMPYNRKSNVLSVSLNKHFSPSQCSLISNIFILIYCYIIISCKRRSSFHFVFSFSFFSGGGGGGVGGGKG